MKLSKEAVSAFEALGVTVPASFESKTKARRWIQITKTEAYKSLNAPKLSGGNVRGGRIHSGERAGQLWGITRVQCVSGKRYQEWEQTLTEAQQLALQALALPFSELIEE